MGWTRHIRAAAAASAWAAALGIATLAGPGGCTAHRGVETEHARAMAVLSYPAEAERGEPLDVLVQRTRSRIRLINRTASSFEDMQLWVNQQYVTELDRVSIGERNVLHLEDFFNRYQEPFPTAWLLAPDRARPLVSAELYDPQREVRYPLTVLPPQ